MTFASSTQADAPSDEDDGGSARSFCYQTLAFDCEPVRTVDTQVSVLFPAVSFRRNENISSRISAARSYIFDAGLAASALIILAPVLAAIALLIWLHDGGPPIFAHRRIGKSGKSFPCLKFRTMVTDADRRLSDLLAADSDAAAEWRRSQKLKSDPRITPIGGFLRRTSLDEVPQLANVLIGHMSLIGPRPIVESEIPHYGRYFRHYCKVRPGITGLWQVSGRSDVTYRRRVAIDTVYCRTKSLALDLSILTKTVPAVLLRRGAS